MSKEYNPVFASKPKIIPFMDKPSIYQFESTKQDISDIFTTIASGSIQEIQNKLQENQRMAIYISDNGDSLLHALLNIPDEIVDERKKLDICRLLINNGCPPDSSNKNNIRPLDISLRKQYIYIIDFLISKRANINSIYNNLSYIFNYTNNLIECPPTNYNISIGKDISDVIPDDLHELSLDIITFIENNKLLSNSENNIKACLTIEQLPFIEYSLLLNEIKSEFVKVYIDLKQLNKIDFNKDININKLINKIKIFFVDKIIKKSNKDLNIINHSLILKKQVPSINVINTNYNVDLYYDALSTSNIAEIKNTVTNKIIFDNKLNMDKLTTFTEFHTSFNNTVNDIFQLIIFYSINISASPNPNIKLYSTSLLNKVTNLLIIDKNINEHDDYNISYDAEIITIENNIPTAEPVIRYILQDPLDNTIKYQLTDDTTLITTIYTYVNPTSSDFNNDFLSGVPINWLTYIPNNKRLICYKINKYVDKINFYTQDIQLQLNKLNINIESTQLYMMYNKVIPKIQTQLINIYQYMVAINLEKTIIYDNILELEIYIESIQTDKTLFTSSDILLNDRYKCALELVLKKIQNIKTKLTKDFNSIIDELLSIFNMKIININKYIDNINEYMATKYIEAIILNTSVDNIFNRPMKHIIPINIFKEYFTTFTNVTDAKVKASIIETYFIYFPHVEYIDSGSSALLYNEIFTKPSGPYKCSNFKPGFLSNKIDYSMFLTTNDMPYWFNYDKYKNGSKKNNSANIGSTFDTTKSIELNVNILGDHTHKYIDACKVKIIKNIFLDNNFMTICNNKFNLLNIYNKNDKDYKTMDLYRYNIYSQLINNIINNYIDDHITTLSINVFNNILYSFTNNKYTPNTFLNNTYINKNNTPISAYEFDKNMQMMLATVNKNYQRDNNLYVPTIRIPNKDKYKSISSNNDVIQTIDHSGKTICYNIKYEFVKKLFDIGFDFNKVDKLNKNSIMYALDRKDFLFISAIYKIYKNSHNLNYKTLISSKQIISYFSKKSSINYNMNSFYSIIDKYKSQISDIKIPETNLNILYTDNIPMLFIFLYNYKLHDLTKRLTDSSVFNSIIVKKDLSSDPNYKNILYNNITSYIKSDNINVRDTYVYYLNEFINDKLKLLLSTNNNTYIKVIDADDVLPQLNINTNNFDVIFNTKYYTLKTNMLSNLRMNNIYILNYISTNPMQVNTYKNIHYTIASKYNNILNKDEKSNNNLHLQNLMITSNNIVKIINDYENTEKKYMRSNYLLTHIINILNDIVSIYLTDKLIIIVRNLLYNYFKFLQNLIKNNNNLNTSDQDNIILKQFIDDIVGSSEVDINNIYINISSYIRFELPVIIIKSIFASDESIENKIDHTIICTTIINILKKKVNNLSLHSQNELQKIITNYIIYIENILIVIKEMVTSYNNQIKLLDNDINLYNIIH